MWTKQMGEKLQTAVLGDDWGTVALISAQVGQKLAKTKVPERHRLGTPWVGAHALLKKK
jgi:hypothetical protein